MNLVEVEVGPRSPFRLPRLTGGDRLIRECAAGFERLIITGNAAVVARVRASARGSYLFTAEAVSPDRVSGPGSGDLQEAGEGQLLEAISRFRFAVGIDLDLAPIRELFGSDPLLAPAITGLAPGRPQRRPYPWEALLWAITEQLIEYKRAAAIQRRMILRWGLRVEDDLVPAGRRRRRSDALFNVPGPEAIVGASPAELEACGLGARRAIAMIKVAREVAGGRADLDDETCDKRLRAIPEIGPWTLACLALRGRGDPDALLAGDLGQVKLVGYLNRLGRIAEVEEVEAFYEKYAPYRGLVGEYLLAAQGKPLSGPGNSARLRMRQNLPRAA